MEHSPDDEDDGSRESVNAKHGIREAWIAVAGMVVALVFYVALVVLGVR